MNVSEHARILSAYLSRLTRKDFERILEADAKWRHACQNNGTNEQIRVQDQFNGVVLEAMGNMLAYDRQNITTIVNKIVNREVTA
jgi:DNA-binding GntR family transcriptional regulator